MHVLVRRDRNDTHSQTHTNTHTCQMSTESMTIFASIDTTARLLHTMVATNRYVISPNDSQSERSCDGKCTWSTCLVQKQQFAEHCTKWSLHVHCIADIRWTWCQQFSERASQPHHPSWLSHVPLGQWFLIVPLLSPHWSSFLWWILSFSKWVRFVWYFDTCHCRCWDSLFPDSDTELALLQLWCWALPYDGLL